MITKKEDGFYEFNDGKEVLVFRPEDDGGIEIQSMNGNEPPEDTNSDEYSKWMFGSMTLVAKIVEVFGKEK